MDTKSPVSGRDTALAARAAHALGEVSLLIGAYVRAVDARGAPLPPDDPRTSSLRVGADRLRRITEDLLELVEARRRELDLGAVAPSAAVLSAMQGLHGAGEGVELRVSPRIPGVLADPRLLERLFQHLLRAALAADARRIAIRGRRVAGGVRIDVDDDGSPRPSRAGAGAADPLPPLRGRGPLVGAGVGPVICDAIVERHGGTLAVRSSAQRTTVSVVLPAAGTPGRG